jgi:hypothetical protein
MGIPCDISSLHHGTATRREDGAEHQKTALAGTKYNTCTLLHCWYMRQQINRASWHLRTPIRVHNMRP